MTIDVDAPFATPEDTRQIKRDSIISGGRYRLPNRDGTHHKGGWMRTTNLVGAFSDQRQLQQWEMRTTLAGLAVAPYLYKEIQAIVSEVGTDPAAIKEDQERLLDVAERAKDVAGGGRGREWGNRMHALVEADHRDLPYVASDLESTLLRLYREALAEARLTALPDMQERILLNEAVGTVGTADNFVECGVTNLVHIADLKTQKRFWSWLEIEAQLATYANADAMWDTDRGEWTDIPYEVDRTRGAVVWCPEPRGEPTVQVRRVDLERGWRTAKLAHHIVGLRSEAKSARQEVSGHSWVPVDLVEFYGRMFTMVSTVEEGRALVAECRRHGVYGPELQASARAAASRISSL